MKNQLFMGMLAVCVAFCCCESVQAGSGKGGGKSSIDVCNHNKFDDENGDIRIWLLTKEQAEKPPTTKAEADALFPLYVPAASQFTFGDEEPGDYVLLAANGTHYQSLKDDDKFASGDNYATKEFTLEKEEEKAFSMVNGDGDNRVPVITEGCDKGPAPGGS